MKLKSSSKKGEFSREDFNRLLITLGLALLGTLGTWLSTDLAGAFDSSSTTGAAVIGLAATASHVIKIFMTDYSKDSSDGTQ